MAAPLHIRARRPMRGMTFLEILVVVMILVTFTALAIPAMRGPHERNKMRAAAREMISMMRYGRSAAVLNDSEVLFEIDQPGARYRLVLPKVVKEKKKFSHKELVNEAELWRPLGKDMAFMAAISWEKTDEKTGYIPVKFFADGSASDAVVVLRNKMDKMLTITVNRATGSASVINGLPEDYDQLVSAGEAKR